MEYYIAKGELEKGSHSRRDNVNPNINRALDLATGGLLRGWAEEQRIGPTYWMDSDTRDAHLAKYDKRMAVLCGYWPPNTAYFAEGK